jgi:hypothetical protein
MNTTTNGYFPLPEYGDSGHAKLAEYNAIMEQIDGVIKQLVDGYFGDNIQLPDNGVVYIGEDGVEGSWRIKRSGNDLQFQRYEGGLWIAKGGVTA